MWARDCGVEKRMFHCTEMRHRVSCDLLSLYRVTLIRVGQGAILAYHFSRATCTVCLVTNCMYSTGHATNHTSPNSVQIYIGNHRHRSDVPVLFDLRNYDRELWRSLVV